MVSQIVMGLAHILDDPGIIAGVAQSLLTILKGILITLQPDQPPTENGIGIHTPYQLGVVAKPYSALPGRRLNRLFVISLAGRALRASFFLLSGYAENSRLTSRKGNQVF